MAKKRFVTKVDRLFRNIDKERKLVEQKHQCYWCGSMLSSRSATFDHVIPISTIQNSYHSLTNTVIACKACNSLRGNVPFEIFSFISKQPSHEKKRLLKVSNIAMNAAKKENNPENLKKLVIENYSDKVWRNIFSDHKFSEIVFGALEEEREWNERIGKIFVKLENRIQQAEYALDLNAKSSFRKWLTATKKN